MSSSQGSVYDSKRELLTVVSYHSVSIYLLSEEEKEKEEEEALFEQKTSLSRTTTDK